MVAIMTKVSSKFAAEVKKSKDFNAAACMHCGVCTAVCPMGKEILPRKLFRYAMLGMEDRLKDNQNVIYQCLLCRMCEENCPADVKIAENIRFLRGRINKTDFDL
jgi:heterodisulfide reductase subunit C